MSTPIYDALCEVMPGPSGPDEEEAARPAPGAEQNGTAGQEGHGTGAAMANGKLSTVHDGQGNGAVTRNGRVENDAAADGATDSAGS